MLSELQLELFYLCVMHIYCIKRTVLSAYVFFICHLHFACSFIRLVKIESKCVHHSLCRLSALFRNVFVLQVSVWSKSNKMSNKLCTHWVVLMLHCRSDMCQNHETQQTTAHHVNVVSWWYFCKWRKCFLVPMQSVHYTMDFGWNSNIKNGTILFRDSQIPSIVYHIAR